MAELLFLMNLNASSLDGVYRNPDTGNYYRVSEKQIVVGKPGDQWLPERANPLDNKVLLLKGYYQ